MKKFLNSILCLMACLAFVGTMNAQCDYTLELIDSFGDGWNPAAFSEDASIEAFVDGVSVGVFVEAGGNPSGVESSTSFTITVNDGSDLRLVYNTSGSFDSEHSFVLSDSEGNEVDTHQFVFGSVDGETFDYVTVCPDVCIIVDCGSNQSVTLQSGQCEAQVTNVITFEGNCALTSAPSVSEGFTGIFDPAGKTTGGFNNALGSIDISGAPAGINLTAGAGAINQSFISFPITEDGTLSVDVDVEGDFPTLDGFNFAGYLISDEDGPNGDLFTGLADGTLALDLSAGDFLVFLISGEGINDVTLDLSNLTYTTQVTGNLDYTVIAGGLETDVELDETAGTLTISTQVPAGVSQVVSVQLTDGTTGAAVSCSYTVSADAYVGTPQDFLQCNGGGNITLNDDCSAVLGAEDVLVGGPYGCFDDYTVVLTDADGNSLGTNVITSPGVHYYMVSGPNGESPCWNTVTAEDKDDPIITCENYEVGCNDATSVNAIGQPTVNETCGGVTLTHEDVVLNGTCADGYLRRIQRTWTATNASGASASCTQIIDVNRQALADVVAPADYDGFVNPTLACDASTDPSVTGYPTVNGEVATQACGLDVSYDDEFHYPCSGTTKIYRTWTIIDWCVPSNGTGANRVELVQFIKLEDKEGPIFDLDDEVTISTDFDACTADYVIPKPNLTDLCADDATLSFTAELISADGELIPLPCNDCTYLAQGLPVGTHTVRYTAVDDCGNQSYHDLEIIVEDQIAPAMSCETYRQVSLQNIDPLEPTLIFAEAFDDGSVDNCEIEKYEVRRMSGCIDWDWTTAGPGNDSDPNGQINFRDRGTSAFYPAVPFACCDLGNTVMVELRITDIYGNSNTCMVEVEVVDKVDPIVVCPEDVTIECLQDIPGYDFLTEFPTENSVEVYAGTPFSPGDFLGYYDQVYDNCGATLYIRELGSLNDCGIGTLQRRFQAIDPSGNTSNICTQRIRVINSDPFEIVDTKNRLWPQYIGDDFDGDDDNFDGIIEGDIINPGYPLLTGTNNPDAIMIHTFEDDVEWPADLTLTCGIDPTPDNLEAGGYALDARPQLVRNDQCDLIAMTYEDLELPIVNNEECKKILRKWIITDHCQFEFDNLTGTPLAGYWEYSQIIKILDNSAPALECPADITIEADPITCLGFANLTIDADGGSCVGETLRYYWSIDANNDGTYDFFSPNSVSSDDASGNYPIGNHRIRWHVEDYCGNMTYCDQLFYVVDASGPLFEAIEEITVDLVSTPSGAGYGVLWATSPELVTIDYCSGVAEVKINYPSLGAGQQVPPASAGSSVQFTCADMGTHDYDFWARDNAGNWTYAILTVNVTDENGLACGPNATSASINGSIATEENAMVEFVNVSVSGSAANMPADFVTTDNGEFDFDLEAGQNYSISAERLDGVNNGISTFDLLLLKQHILGLQELDSPYKMIAADVNASGNITSLDMIALRRVILLIDNEFSNNTSWRFVDADFVFADATNPFAATFPEAVNINDLSGQELADFVAIKVGDLNGSAVANSLASGDTRTAGDLTFNIADAKVAAGETFTVDFTAADFAEIAGYQFTLNFDAAAVEFVDFKAGALTELTADNFGFHKLSEGVITTSYAAAEAVKADADEVLFSLTFAANANTQVSRAINVSSAYTKAEAYNNNNADLLDVNFNFNTPANVLFQNQPNPFKAETVIGFELAEAADAAITIYDVAGRVVKQYNGDFAKGYNEVTVNSAELNASGVLYYTLKTADFSATKKMILVK